MKYLVIILLLSGCIEKKKDIRIVNTNMTEEQLEMIKDFSNFNKVYMYACYKRFSDTFGERAFHICLDEILKSKRQVIVE